MAKSEYVVRMWPFPSKDPRFQPIHQLCERDHQTQARHCAHWLSSPTFKCTECQLKVEATKDLSKGVDT